MAILLARAILTWRYGPDGVPGTAGTEERRLGHLPRWNSKLGDTAPNAGVGYPNATCTGINIGNVLHPPSYPFSTTNAFDWGWGDGLPSRLTMICFPALNPAAPLPTLPTLYPNSPPPPLYALNLAPNLGNFASLPNIPWSYAEPGVWTSYQGGVNWSNDTGLPTPGLFWGKVGAGSTPTSIVADTTQPGWPEGTASQPGWAPSEWVNTSTPPAYTYYVYFATGPLKSSSWGVNNNTNYMTLSVANMPATPQEGRLLLHLHVSNRAS